MPRNARHKGDLVLSLLSITPVASEKNTIILRLPIRARFLRRPLLYGLKRPVRAVNFASPTISGPGGEVKVS